MAYPYYQPSYYPQQNLLAHYPQTAMPQQPQTTVFYNVPSEDVARRWNVEPNTTARFVDDNDGYFYTKTVGASILEPPVFEKYKIVKEGNNNNNVDCPQRAAIAEADLSEYMTKAEFEDYKSIINDMQEIVKELKGNG